MRLALDRPLIVFDLETTGLNIIHDRIVELSYIKVEPNGNRQSATLRINPGFPIPAEATAVHGITDQDVADCPKFSEVAPQLAEVFKNCDFAGFNSNHFDIPLLAEEMLRAGVEFDLSNTHCIDVQNIFHKMERRTLIAAYKFYCGKDLTDAHSASADTNATYEVLLAQLERYGDALQNDVKWLADFTRINRNADLTGRMVYNSNDEIVFNFGKYKGQRVADVLASDPGYYGWIMHGDFAQSTKDLLTKIRKETRIANKQQQQPTFDF